MSLLNPGEHTMAAVGIVDGARRYAFECPSCGESGYLGLDPKDVGQFGCPAECGASFIEYQDGDTWKIRCVVQPVFLGGR